LEGPENPRIFFILKKKNIKIGQKGKNFYSHSLDRVLNSVPDAGTEFETRSQIFLLRLYVFKNDRKLRLSLKLGPRELD
jgi:hypothetical protein